MKRQTLQGSSHTQLISFLRRKHQALRGFKMLWGQKDKNQWPEAEAKMNPNEEILIVSQSSREIMIFQPLMTSERECACLEDVPY